MSKPRKAGKQCNICNHPSIITYKQKDDETGIIVEKQHLVECLGHIGILPYYWNLHPNYEEYRRYKRRKTTQGE